MVLTLEVQMYKKLIAHVVHLTMKVLSESIQFLRVAILY